MNKNNTASAAGLQLLGLEAAIKESTVHLMSMAANDPEWWAQALPLLAKEAVSACQTHLRQMNDSTFEDLLSDTPEITSGSAFTPLEALCWLMSLCEFDRLCVGVLPRAVIDEVGLQWRVAALHWLA